MFWYSFQAKKAYQQDPFEQAWYIRPWWFKCYRIISSHQDLTLIFNFLNSFLDTAFSGRDAVKKGAKWTATQRGPPHPVCGTAAVVRRGNGCKCNKKRRFFLPDNILAIIEIECLNSKSHHLSKAG
jgi:hypothetical protein